MVGRQSPSAVEQVVVDLLPDVRRWVRAAVGPYDSEDVLQECVIELLDALERFRGDAQLKTYAHRVVTHAAIARRRKQRRFWGFFASNESEAAETLTANPEQLLQTSALQRRVHAHLRTLRPEHQECLIYVWVEGLTQAEAAGLQGVPLETFRSRLKVARDAFERLARRDALLAQWAEHFDRTSESRSTKFVGLYDAPNGNRDDDGVGKHGKQEAKP